MIVLQLLVHAFFHVPGCRYMSLLSVISIDTDGPFWGTQTALFQQHCYIETIEIEEQ